MLEDISEILFTREVIEERVKELAAHVQGAYRDSDLTVAVVLNGAFMFGADLVRHLASRVEIVFIRSSSYLDSDRPQQAPRVQFPRGFDWTGRHVLVVEDIVDTGRTAQALLDAVSSSGAASVRICTFLDKPAAREVTVDVDFHGFVIEGTPFVVGYGLDYASAYRNLPFVGVLAEPARPTAG